MTEATAPSQQSTEVLKACPFCKGDRAYISDHESAALHVCCRDCGAQLWGHKRHFSSRQEAAAAWNHRAAESEDASRPPSSAGKYDEVLVPFFKLMEQELHANTGKGDRPGWLKMTPDKALLEIYYHVAKLQKAVKSNDGPRVREHSADVANLAMMALDACGGLHEPDWTEVATAG